MDSKSDDGNQKQLSCFNRRSKEFLIDPDVDGFVESY